MVCCVFNLAVIGEQFQRASACASPKCGEYPGVMVGTERDLCYS